MLPLYLERFNQALTDFQHKFARPNWSADFKSGLINDFSFYSSKVEDPKLEYGDTLRFLNDQFVKKEKMGSFMEIANHTLVLESIINRYDSFELTEDTIKSIHRDLMNSPLAWDTDFKPELVGNYRNIPTIGRREPYFRDKEYVPHYNLEFSMPSHLEFFIRKFNNIENSKAETHLLTALAYFHNIFLNYIHPFADGNGRVCRIIMGTIMMKNNCPPVFSRILTNEDMMAYITTIIECEQKNSDEPLIIFLANGMSEYLEKKVSE